MDPWIFGWWIRGGIRFGVEGMSLAFSFKFFGFVFSINPTIGKR